MKEEHIRHYVLAGNSYFTLKNAKTGRKFHFQVKKDVKYNQFYVYIRGKYSGAYIGYVYMGAINFLDEDIPLKYSPTDKSLERVAANHPAVIAFDWFWKRIENGHYLPESVTVTYNGRCGRCRYKLTDKPSIVTGVGPCCTKIIAKRS